MVKLELYWGTGGEVGGGSRYAVNILILVKIPMTNDNLLCILFDINVCEWSNWGYIGVREGGGVCQEMLYVIKFP